MPTNPISDRPAHKGYPGEICRPSAAFRFSHELGGFVPAGGSTSETSETSEHETSTSEAGWVIVSIGRNIESTSGRDLPLSEWEEFKRDTVDLFASLDFRVDGGISTSEEHGSEETFTAGGTCSLTRRELERTLAILARWYFQDAISLTYGGGERIEATAGGIYARSLENVLASAY
jgi:hypothetical protein